MRSSIELLLAACLLGSLGACNGGTRCLDCDRHSDAGDAAPPAPPSCPVTRACPHVKSVADPQSVFLGNGNGGLVQLGNAVMTSKGVAVSWTLSVSSGGGAPRSGVALLSTGEVVSFDDGSASAQQRYAPPLFQRADEVDLLVPAGAWNRVLPIALDDFSEGPELTLPGTPVQSQAPAVLGVGQALAALLEPGPELVFFDATFGERLLETPLGNQGEPWAMAPTCDGLIGIWYQYGLVFGAFDTLGNPRGTGHGGELSASFLPNAAWDGASVVVAGFDSVAEIADDGSVTSETPMKAGAAIGTDDGLLVAGYDAHVLRTIERGTGQVLDAYSKAWIDASAVVVGQRSAIFIEGGEGSIDYVTVDCEQ